MPTSQHHHVVRTDILELKSQIEKKIGRVKTESYFTLLSKFLSFKISKSDFDKLVVVTLKKENVSLHNALLRGIIKNVCVSKTLPFSVDETEKKKSFRSLCEDLPKSPRKGRTHHRRFKDCNGSKGKSNNVSEVVNGKQQWLTEEEDGEEVDQFRSWRSQPIEAPFGVNLKDGIKRRRRIDGTCYSSGELLDSVSLKKKLEDGLGLTENGLEVSVGFAKVLNVSLDVFLKRLIKPCLELASTRSNRRGEVCSTSSLVDFQVAMELNPSLLGEDWPTKLEKIRMVTPHSPADFKTS